MMECIKSMAKKPQTNADRIRSMTDEELGYEKVVAWMPLPEPYRESMQRKDIE